MLRPFFNRPKIYNQILQNYIDETNKRYLRKLNENCEKDKKNALINSTIKKYLTENEDVNKNRIQLIGSISCFLLASSFMFFLYKSGR